MFARALLVIGALSVAIFLVLALVREHRAQQTAGARRARWPRRLRRFLLVSDERTAGPAPERRLVLPELRPKPRPADVARCAPTRHPIVLAHGYMGFDAIVLPRARKEYFRGVRERLEAAGHRVHSVRVAPAAGVELRAAQLARQIERLDAERVNIVAHSMGGLDARYAIARLGLHERVASLTTIGTPHRGTPLADTGANWIGEWRQLRRMLNSVGANVDGLYDLTTERMARFNDDIPDVSGVAYSSVVGAVGADTTCLNALLAPGHAYLLRTVGSNDGIVPAESQRWGSVLGEVDADHWEQIGWSGSFDAQSFYAVLAAHLSEWGL